MNYRDKILDHLKKESNTFSTVDPEDLIKAAEELGKELNRDILKNHQLRRLFNAIKGIEYGTTAQRGDDNLESDIVAQLIFLKIHIANVEKNAKGELLNFRKFMDEVLSSKNIKRKKDLDYFVRFFEAILAYHS